MLLAYKYRIYPAKADKILLAKHFGCCRFLYNYFLAYRQNEYQKGNKVSYYMTQKELTKMKTREEYSWLNEVASQSLQMAIQQLDDAYKRFFRQQGGYPKFKTKHESVQSCSFPQRVMLEGNRVFLPKFMKNGIKINIHRELPEGASIKQATISKKNNRYYVSISFDDNMPTPKPVIAQSSIGLDVGINSLVATSKDAKIANPRYTKKYARMLKLASRHLSRKQHPSYKGDKTERSKNFIKATRRLAKLSERITNIRNDFNHKETSKVVADHKFIAMETLNVTGMVKNRKLAKSISDVSYGDLSSKIEYKARYSNRYIYYADMFFASSKTCLNCLNKNSELKLSDRIFVCPSCGFTIDRDTAAAINLREEMERYLIGIAHPEFTLVERSSVDDRSLGYLRSTFSMKQEDSINLLK